MEKRIVVYGKEIEHDGKKFWGYKAETSNGNLIRCSFTQSINVAPPKSSIFIMVLNSESKKNNVSHAKRYPVLWVSEVERYEEYETLDNTLDEYFN